MDATATAEATKVAADLGEWLTILQTSFAAILTLLTFFYVLTTRRQLKAMHDALEETRRSNNATEESNKIAERTLELGSRAWLALVGISTRQKVDGPERTTTHHVAEVTIKNVGRAPAIGVETLFYVTIFEGGSVPTDFVPTSDDRKTVIAADESVSVIEPLPRFIPALDLKLRSKEISLFVYCELRYTDIFSKARITSAAWEVTSSISGLWVHVPRYRRME
ncbi:MAG: hypothetical protein ACJ75H_21660 [Thermoanaerobaculia bacterium]